MVARAPWTDTQLQNPSLPQKQPRSSTTSVPNAIPLTECVLNEKLFIIEIRLFLKLKRYIIFLFIQKLSQNIKPMRMKPLRHHILCIWMLFIKNSTARTPMKTRIFCAHAGGQGKTTVAQVVYAAVAAKDIELKLAAADFIDQTGSSKLGRLFPGLVDELGTGPSVSLAKDSNDLNANIRYWDAFGPLLLKGGHIIDMGANVIDQVLRWGQIRQAPKLLTARSAPAIDVFLVCKAEQRAVDDMSDLVRRFSSQVSFPLDKIFIVLNEQGGSFEGLDIRAKLARIATNVNIEFITVPRCASELWIPMEQSYSSVQRVLALNEDDIVKELGVDFWAANSGIDDLKSWFHEVYTNLKASSAI